MEFYTANSLPLSLNNITVSFDAPATGSLPAISAPGYLRYVDSGQVNVFVPWELQGYSSVQIKVTVNEYDYGALVTCRSRITLRRSLKPAPAMQPRWTLNTRSSRRLTRRFAGRTSLFT